MKKKGYIQTDLNLYHKGMFCQQKHEHPLCPMCLYNFNIICHYCHKILEDEFWELSFSHFQPYMNTHLVNRRMHIGWIQNTPQCPCSSVWRNMSPTTTMWLTDVFYNSFCTKCTISSVLLKCLPNLIWKCEVFIFTYRLTLHFLSTWLTLCCYLFNVW